jgi:hypothetical protein
MVVGIAGLLLAMPAAADWTVDGHVVALDGIRSAVSLDHGPAGDVLPAARTEFPVARRELLNGIALGDTVRATLAAASGSHGLLEVTELERVAPPGQTGASDGWGRTTALVIGTALLGLLALWLETRRLRRSLGEAGQTLMDITRRHAAGQRKLNADVEAVTRALDEIARALASQLASAAERVRLAQAGREDAEPPPDRTDLPVFIVRAGEVDTYRMLAERLARHGRAQVLWDRRRRDRRSGLRRVSLERRRGERREPPPPTWLTLGYAAVPPASERRLTSAA